MACTPSGAANLTSDTLSGCTGTDVSQTGKTGVFTAKGGTPPTSKVVWKTGKTSTIGDLSANNVTNNCPSRSGLKKTNKVKYTGKVTGGTAGELVGGSWEVETCTYQTSAASGSQFRYYFDGEMNF